MPPFPKPIFEYSLDVLKEVKNIRKYRDTKIGRSIPKSVSGNILIATWNIANLGVQKREQDHYKIISEMIQWFDVIAIQEVNDNLEGMLGIRKDLPSKYGCIYTDASGNNERMAYLYNKQKVELLEEFGEIAVPAENNEDIKLPNNGSSFTGFSRNPFIASFRCKNFDFILANAHSYFGKEDERLSMERRSLEAYAIARWADLKRKSKHSQTTNIIALGDFNMPKVEIGDPIYDALLARGFEMPKHSTEIYSNITNDKHYDQVVFLPGMKSKVSNSGSFDFDGALFPDLYQQSEKKHKVYTRYYISDHRIKWIEITH
jgi:endonuclease/exonuclease/phosphatase family metal-dependent hydrolase